MARIRTIKPEFPQSESMGRISRDARLTFVLIWTIADDSGRLRGNSRMLASLLFPYDDDAPKKIDGWLSELEAEKCIVRYLAHGDNYLQVCNWLSHQKIDKPSPSKIPPFENIREDSPNIREHSSLDQDQDQDQDQGSRTTILTSETASPSSEAVLVFPCDGKPKTWELTQAKVDHWRSLYPSLDVMSECRKAMAWVESKPTNRKTHGGMATFLVGWFNRVQNRGSTANGNGTAKPERQTMAEILKGCQ